MPPHSPAAAQAEGDKSTLKDDPAERGEFHGAARIAILAGTLTGVFLAIHQLFNLQLLGVVLIEGRYLYILGGIFLAIAFLSFRIDLRKGGPVPLYDWVLAAAALAVSGYFAWTAETALDSGWEYAAPTTAQWASLAFYLLILEGTRRAGGVTVFLFVLAFSLYPTFADQMPGPISGFASPFWDAIPYHILSAESSFGIPMRAFGNLVIGFILFGALLQRTGGGQFFNDLALAMVGRFRGGAAKVAIFASGFMGSMSGSVISNVLTTGAVSIPAMKKTGFSARYAAATEACASTGGVLTPPIMGATAFVMASFLSRPYIEIALAAAIPALLYYFSLFIQIDAYAARRGLRGLTREELPKAATALRDGWLYLFVFGLLIFLMVALRQETLAPFYAVALLLVMNQVLKRHRLTLKGAGDMIVGVGRALAELTAVLLGIGLIVGSFSATGLAGTLVNDLVFLAGDNVLALLAMGAVTAFVFGMGMTVTACYIFLAVVLAPALEQAGLNRLAVHLFILYWGMVSFITPPVALGAFAAATMAGASAMRTGVEAMKLGGVIYIAPFLFVLNPALVGEAPAGEVATALIAALIGVWLIGAALQGHLAGVGGFGDGLGAVAARTALFFGGLAIAAPGFEVMGLDRSTLLVIGAALSAGPALYAWRRGETTPLRDSLASEPK
ncbi:MAG: TRAP transporter fused permease subunit [Rhodobacteraceae bacterium]|nr:TRAP transporter fused permease subunit [Paracoccaceae bacterium]